MDNRLCSQESPQNGPWSGRRDRNLMGGNISNTGIYDPDNPESIEKVKLINKVC